jgi:NADPH:quinone reductase
MRAWRVNELGHPSTSLVLEDIPSPEPPAGQVRIRVEATNVNFADILVCQGIYQDRPGVPLTPGTEACGVIQAVGHGVDLAVGTRIAGMTNMKHGGYGEEALIKAESVLVMPDDLDAADATVLYSTFQTAHVGLFHRCQLEEGQWVLILGASSGVGAAAVQLAAERGARVIAVAGGAAKQAHCRELGAEITIDSGGDSTGDDAAERLYAATMEATHGLGVDVAFDPVGGPLGNVTRRLMAFEGRLVVIGFASGDIPSYPGNHVLVKNYAVLGMAWAEYTKRRRPVIEAAHDDILRLHRQGRIRTDVSAIRLDELPGALAALEARSVIGRLAMVP